MQLWVFLPLLAPASQNSPSSSSPDFFPPPFSVYIPMLCMFFYCLLGFLVVSIVWLCFSLFAVGCRENRRARRLHQWRTTHRYWHPRHAIIDGLIVLPFPTSAPKRIIFEVGTNRRSQVLQSSVWVCVGVLSGYIVFGGLTQWVRVSIFEYG